MHLKIKEMNYVKAVDTIDFLRILPYYKHMVNLIIKYIEKGIENENKKQKSIN